MQQDKHFWGSLDCTDVCSSGFSEGTDHRMRVGSVTVGYLPWIRGEERTPQTGGVGAGLCRYGIGVSDRLA
jgi:hypothetical protein